jgi:hypothetical protein
MNVFSPSQSMNVFAQGANIGGNIRQAQTNAKLAPLVANGQYDQAAQVAGQRGDLGSAELYRSQYQDQLAQMGEQEKAAAAKRAEDLARVAVSLKGVPYEQRPVALQQQLPMLQAMGMDPQQIQGFDPSDQNLDAVLAQVTPLQELLKGPEYYAPVETDNGYAQFSKDGSDPRQFEGIAPAVDLPTGMRMGENGPEYIPQYMEGQERLKAAGRSQVTVNTGDVGSGQRPIVDKPPKGYQRVWDEAEGTYRDVPIPGGEAARAEEEANTKAYQAFQADREQMGAIMENIDAADTLINNWTAGAGSLLDSIPATQARDLKARMETVRANIGFDKLNEMRQTSPTGGALGQVTERELNFLQSVRGSLDTGQSPDQLRQTLQEIKASLQRLQEVRQIAFQLQYAEPGQERPQIRTVERPSNDDLPEGFEIVE